MKHPERVEDYLAHIAEAIERAISYVQPLPDLDALQRNQMVQDAVVRNIEIMGEAVKNIDKMSPDFIRHHPGVPWAKMRAMRNVVIHEYFFVDLQIIWSTVKDDLPLLRQQILALLTERRVDHDDQQQGTV